MCFLSAGQGWCRESGQAARDAAFGCHAWVARRQQERCLVDTTLAWAASAAARLEASGKSRGEDGMGQNCGTTCGHQKGPNILDVPKMCVFDSVFHVS